MNYSTYRAVNTARFLKHSMLYREIVDVRFQIGTKHVKLLRGQEAEVLVLRKSDDVQSNC